MPTLILRSKPGIKRDGTKFDGDFYTDGKWMRIQRGLPRKIGGFRAVSKRLSGASRGFSSITRQSMQYCHSGSSAKLESFTLDSGKNSSSIHDRTPVGMPVSVDNRWMFSYAYEPSSYGTAILAHVAPNGACACNSVGGNIYYGDAFGTAALAPITLPSGANATGGIVMLHPYLFYYGSDGVVGWSVAGSPSDLTGSGSGIARVWGQKIIKGMPLRAGSGSAPAGLFWAYDALIRANFTGGSTVFQFDTIATDTSIISADSVVEYDGVFFWCGVDRFLMFNGVVRDVPNQMNLNWFFDNLNPAQRSKVFAFKVTRYGEIWWCYPRGSATECTHAVIYNVREDCWYDTELPSDGRSAGQFNNAYAAPILVGSTQHSTGYKVWVHEQGVDEIDGTSIAPVQSYFETADLSSLVQGQNSMLRVHMIEPDFIQSGDMQVTITGRANARAPEVYGQSVTFVDEASVPNEQIVVLREQRRELRARFESNVIGGDYQMGQIIAHVESGDGTVL